MQKKDHQRHALGTFLWKGFFSGTNHSINVTQLRSGILLTAEPKDTVGASIAPKQKAF